MAGGVAFPAGRGGGRDPGTEERMSVDRTRLGLDVEEALKDVLVHVRGEITLSCRIFGEQSAGRRDLSAANTQSESAGRGTPLDLDMRAAQN